MDDVELLLQSSEMKSSQADTTVANVACAASSWRDIGGLAVQQ